MLVVVFIKVFPVDARKLCEQPLGYLMVFTLDPLDFLQTNVDVERLHRFRC